MDPVREGPDKAGRAPVDTGVGGFRDRVRKGVSRLKGVDVTDQLEIEILSQLLDGNRTSAEIVHSVYGLGRGDPGFSSVYSRVRRSLRRLEYKGLVSRKLFGRDRPYRLTQLAKINLARIGGEEEQVGPLRGADLLVWSGTVCLAGLVGALGSGWVRLPNPALFVVFGSFFYFLGLTTSSLIHAVRRVS